MDDKKQPKWKIKAGSVVATVWENEQTKGEQTFPVHSIQIERRYQDREGNWKSANSFRVNDVPKVILVAQKAYEALVLKERE